MAAHDAILLVKLCVASCVTIGQAVSVNSGFLVSGTISSRHRGVSWQRAPRSSSHGLSSADPTVFQEVFEPGLYWDAAPEHAALQNAGRFSVASTESHCWPLFVNLGSGCSPWPFAILLMAILLAALVKMGISFHKAASIPDSTKQWSGLECMASNVERRPWDAWCSFWTEDFKAFTHPEASRFIFLFVLLLVIFLDPIIGRADFASAIGAPHLLSQAPPFLRDPWPTAALWPLADGQGAFVVAHAVLALWLLALLLIALSPCSSGPSSGHLQTVLSSLLLALALGALWLQGLARGLIGCSHRYTALGIFWIGLALSEGLVLMHMLAHEKKDGFLRKWTLTTLVYMMFAGGIAKLVMTGPTWADGTVLELSMRERLVEPDGGLMSHKVTMTAAFCSWLLEYRTWTMPLMGFGALAFELGCIVVLIPQLPWLRALRWLFAIGLLGLFLGIASVLGITFWPQCCLLLIVLDIPAVFLSCLKYFTHDAASPTSGTSTLPDADSNLKRSHATGIVGILFCSAMISAIALQAEAWPFSSIPMYAYKIDGLDEHCRFSSGEFFLKHIEFCTRFPNQPCLPWCAVQVQVGADSLRRHAAASGDRFVEVQPRSDLPFSVGDVGKVLTVQWQTKLLTSVRQAAISQKWNFTRLAESLGGEGSRQELDPINSGSGPAAEELKALAVWLTGQQILCPANGGPLKARLLPRLVAGVPDLVLASVEREC
mmetsp:Transcript_135694/g.247429  ORF Transcript_135694/g.247429 Transcript_135694/m.247429 type:complete len:716 (+) Transcript_135694:119-2266(+)